MKPLRINDMMFYQEDGIGKIEYGYYPNRVPQKEVQKKLFELYRENNIHETGNHYTIDEHSIFEYSDSFEPHKVKEYEYEGNRYVLIKARLKFGDQKMKFNRVLLCDLF